MPALLSMGTTPVIECGIEAYRIRCGVLVSRDFDYGDPAHLYIQDVDESPVHLIALVHELDNGERISMLPNAPNGDPIWVMMATVCSHTFDTYDENESDENRPQSHRA